MIIESNSGPTDGVGAQVQPEAIFGFFSSHEQRFERRLRTVFPGSAGRRLPDQRQSFKVLGAIARQAIHERQADVFFVGDSAKLDELADIVVVTIDMRLSPNPPKG